MTCFAFATGVPPKLRLAIIDDSATAPNPVEDLANIVRRVNGVGLSNIDKLFQHEYGFGYFGPKIEVT